MKTKPLIENISKHIKLSQEEVLSFDNFWTERTVAKGEYLLWNGKICRYDTYVISGALKAFYINPKNGDEEILYFAIDDWWASDLVSFSQRVPSIYSIQSIEQTKVLQIDYFSFQRLLKEQPRLERYFRIILESYLGTLQKRIIFNNAYDAEFRYFDFLKTYPKISKKVPQYLIASYLGISAEFISRIRKKNLSS